MINIKIVLRREIALIFVLTIGCFKGYSQFEEKIKEQYQLSRSTVGWFEGFSKNRGENEFTYHSLRDDVKDGLLTRATDGDMFIEWETASVSKNWKNKNADFLWITAMASRRCNEIFFMSVNGEQKFMFTNSKNDWEVKSEDGGKLSFRVFELDRHKDSHGYMTLHAPAQWITPGEPLTLRITGDNAGSNCWFIVYRASDALNHLHQTATHETWFDVEINKTMPRVLLIAPLHMEGETITVKISEYIDEGRLVATKDFAQVVFYQENKNIFAGEGEIKFLSGGKKVFTFPLPLTEKEISTIRDETIVMKTGQPLSDGSWLIQIRVKYKPYLVKNLRQLSDSHAAGGKLLLMNSSHQDIAWMDSPEKCIIERDTMLLAPLFDEARDNPGYRFDIEDVMMVKEFIHRHPERKPEFGKMLREGIFSCGSSYNMPYEEMYSGESLARQFYLGAKWLKDEFGYEANTYYNVDVPGRTLQMPQILKKAGTDYMVISRHEKGIFKWYSPDGSFVTTYSPGHYSLDYPELHKNFFDAAGYLAKKNMFWDKYFEETNEYPVIPVLSDWDMSPAEDYSLLINKWQSLDYYEDSKGNVHSLELPDFEITTVPGFIRRFVEKAGELPNIRGERPAVWLYIHGPSHQKALKASREGDILLTAAEKFSSVSSMLFKSFRNYPAEKLNKAWEAKIFPDHGWGGKKGDITDALFLQKLLFSRNEAENILNKTTGEVASMVKTEEGKGIPLIVFNSLSWNRTDPVSEKLVFEQNWGKNICLENPDGEFVPVQLSEINRFENGNISSAIIHFIAEDVPSLGYKTFYVSGEKKAKSDCDRLFTNVAENKYYRLSFTNGGLNGIFDKELDRQILNTTNLLGGEVFTLHSEGNGAGEFADVQQPDMEGFDRTNNYKTKWELVESGPVFDTYRVKTPFKNVVVEQKIKLFHNIKRIDFEIALLNWEGELYREFRMALPLSLDNARITYEVPYGVVEVGKDEIKGAAGERYITPCKEVHPRGIQNWIGASGKEFGVTLSSSVVVVDYIDPTDKKIEFPVLQPILFASRKSFHGEGNEYLQTGDHFFSFSLTTHKPGWQNGYQFGRRANEKLTVVVDPELYKNANLPGKYSFVEVEKSNLLITALKKAEDNAGIILRIVEMEGSDTQSRITFTLPVKKCFCNHSRRRKC